MFRLIPSKKKKGLCPAYRCKNKIANKKRFCHRHHAQYQKETNPFGYFYSQLKQNAKRRGIEFKLTREEFERFCIKTNYLDLKGKSANSASIDRIDPNKGYEIENIQILSLSENTKKMHRDNSSEPEDEIPF